MSVKTAAHAFSLLIALCSLLIVSCELFTGPKVDLFQVISDEVDWANAAKLSVRVEHPAAWGISNPTGTITPAKDIRKGYAFEIEYTPDLAYSLAGWRAYATSSLPANWVLDTSLLDGIERLDGVSVEIPDLPARGGTGSFIINTAEPVTLVPWCKTEPYVIRTVPRDSPNMLYPRGTDIVIYFNAPLNLTPGEIDLFTTGAIKITGGGDDFSAYYNKPVYDANNDLGEYKITISPSDVPGDALIEVTVGPKIYNAAGEPMSKPEVFSFKTASSTLSGSITEWSASYNGSAITVGWTAEGAVDVAARYRVNQGGDNALSGGSPAVIRGVSQPNVSDVRNGTGVSGIREYEIFLDLYIGGIKSNAGSVSFKIWNIPDMNITHNNTVLLDNDNFSAALVAAGSSGKNFILIEDIEIDSWTPAGTSASPFSGRFYGNGHTVTIGGMNAPVPANTGLFGYAHNALIRDLTLVYNAAPITGVSAGTAYSIGGAAGYLNNTNVINVTTSGGTLAVTAASGSGAVRIGGIAGYVESGKIENCRAALSASYTSSGHTGEVLIGAVAGETGEGSTGNTKEAITIFNGTKNISFNFPRLLIDKVTVVVNVSANKGANAGFLSVGGAVGKSGKNTMNDIRVSAGNVLYYRSEISSPVDNYAAYCGGLVGNSVNTNIVECSFSGNVGTISASPDGAIVFAFSKIGGLIGYNLSPTGSDSCFIHNCRVRGNIEIMDDYNNLDVGGFLGRTQNDGVANYDKITITNCFFEEGKIVVSSGNIVNLGGFCGGEMDTTHIINNCGTLAGTIDITLKKYIYVGGFASSLNGLLSNCFSRIDINVSTEGGSGSVGGFMGFLSGDSTITSCYVTGTVNILVNNGSYFTAGSLVGSSDGIIQNSYALGNVLINKIGGNSDSIICGGIVGNNWGPINNCFSACEVVAQNSAGIVRSGGIVGSNQYSVIKNTAALGKSVTAKGSSDVNAGRIYGSEIPGQIAGSGSGNLAKQSMRLETGAYTATNITDSAPALGNGNAAGQHGQTVNDSNFLNPAFWTTTLGFSADIWDFSKVGRDGYPRLKWEE